MAPEADAKRRGQGRRALRDRLGGVRTRIGTLVVTVLVIVGGTTGALLVHALVSDAHQVVIDRAAGLLRAVARPCAAALTRGEIEHVDGYLDDLTDPGGGIILRHVLMLDEEGRRVAASWRGADGDGTLAGIDTGVSPGLDFMREAAQGDAPIWERRESDLGRPILWLSMPAVSGLRWGTVVASFDLSGLHDKLVRIRLAVALIAVLMALLVGLVMYIGVYRTVLVPLDALRRAAGTILGGDLSARAQVVRADDELGEVAQTFNAMAEELEEYTEFLEQHVAERTAEVERKNQELQEVNVRLAQANEELERLALTDELTGLLNRRAFRERMAIEVHRSTRAGYLISLILVDIDHFKRVNDTFGHGAGDAVLRELGVLLANVHRQTDVVGRIGGEEFAVLLLDTGVDDARRIAELLRRRVAAHDFVTPDGRPVGELTLSLGVTVLAGESIDLDTMLDRGDVALYAAKARGRNRVVAWTDLTLEQEAR